LARNQQAAGPVIQFASHIPESVVVHRMEDIIADSRKWRHDSVVQSLPNLGRVRDFVGGFVRGDDQSMWGIVMYRMGSDPRFKRSDSRRLRLFLELMQRRREACVRSIRKIDPVMELSDGHQDVFNELFGGLSEKEIAIKLGYKPNTVNSYIRDICDRLEVRGRLRLVAEFGKSFHSRRRAAF
jgi:DNA-binding CsgD family transcriptional regulator